jgi:hypothetical protein
MMIAADTDRKIDTQGNPVGESKFDLGSAAARAENAQARYDALPRADDGERFFRSELAVLVQVFHGAKFVAFAE